ncbi:uncharacterized protein B0T15DRAFT_405376 [Chaetomium strumarium]|uniref:Uncharacterized protein n=1 Tax=Chaetomium strumarium TaxID=1170767 RepID=A0AAJ0GKM8_9PEZI|nr:hypothetical protein B0T15DRAFT_405376 [Chaetomium strumarium]
MYRQPCLTTRATPYWIEPQCHHLTMAAIYHDTLRCMRCERQPPEGFLYRCTVDREPLILSAKAKGDRVTFDSLGDAFAEEMTLGRFGPDARRKQHSFLNEITPEEITSYTLEQLSTILEQRKNVIDDQRRECYRTGKIYPDDTMPWVRQETHECQHVVCHQCYPRGREKSWVSLNGVLNGDILPTVATGFSFSYSGSRPCADANVVRNIGCRAVPLVRITHTDPFPLRPALLTLSSHGSTRRGLPHRRIQGPPPT